MEVLRASETVKETVISCLEAPRLKGISTKHFVEFKRLRELYEKQLEEKSRHLKEEIIPTSYKASIDNEDLKIFIAAGWIECSSIDEITERQIEECVENRCIREAEGEDLHLVEHAVKNVSMQMHIIEPEDRIWSLHRAYSLTLCSAGYGYLMETKPHIAIQHFLKRLKPTQPYQRMVDIIKWRKNENFHQENFDRFVREVVIQAKKIQSEQRLMPVIERSLNRDNGDRRKRVKIFKSVPVTTTDASGPQLHEKNDTERQRHGIKRKRDAYEAPLCLNPTCRANGRRHYISTCDISDQALKNSLLEEYRKAKKAKQEERPKPVGNIRRIASTPTSPHSSLFKATFANGKVETNLLADQGADANFLSAVFLQNVQESEPSIISERLKPSQVYRNVTGDPCLTCNTSVKLDVFLKIRHGTNLILRNITWKVTEEDLSTPIIGRRVLESLGCDNREMLMAARDKWGSSIDVNERLKTDGNEEAREGVIAALYGEPVFHSGGYIEDDALNDEEVYVDLGDEPIEEVDRELEERLKEASVNGLSKDGTEKLKMIIQQNKSVFRIRLGSGGPAKVTPMKIKLDESKKPVKVKVRKYPADQRRYLNAYFNKLVKMGFLKMCPEASWQAAPHLVPKDSKSKFRTTIDLRPVNAVTKPEQWPMPIIEAELSDFMGSKHFASLDFCSSYWQCPLHPDSYDACGIVAPQGTYTSTRVLHGLKNASAYFQSTIPPLFDSMKHAMKAWIDDFTLHTKTEEQLLNHLKKFFRICIKHNLYLSAKKSVLYTKEVKWCGRIIDSTGYKLDPKNIEAIRTMEDPINAAELCQFIHCCRWMSTSVPDFHRRMQPLDNILEQAYAQAGRRKKNTLKNIPLHKLSWGTEHRNAIASIQDSLKSTIKVAFPKPDHEVCVYTDASEEMWAAIVTQTEENQLGKDVQHQTHEPLAFLGGKFNKSQKNWTTYEKEAYAIVQTFDRLDYLFWGARRTHVFTDHKNLLYVFAPLALRPNSPRHVLSKVHRWAIHLSRFEFFINHIEGKDNVFADILTRWSKGYRITSAQTNMIAALYEDIIPSSISLDVTSVMDIKREQDKYKPPTEATKDNDGLVKVQEKIWIPDEAENLKLKIAVQAHCGEKGHRAKKATLEVISREYWWKDMMVEVEEFVQSCIHCIVSRNGERVPRPLATALHGERPNEVVHSDFLYMGPAEESNLKYLLITKDDISSYTWLFPSENADSDAATTALTKWITCFGEMEWLVTDQGSHFTSSLMNNLTSRMHIKHHLTTAYCPWSNGTVERVCREVLRAARSLLSEWRMSVGQWPTIVEVIQRIINHSPVERLGKNADGNVRCPMEVFLGLKPSPLVATPSPLIRYRDLKALTEERCRQIVNISNLHATLEQMHKEVSSNNRKRRTTAQRTHNAKTHVLPINIEVGSYVMVRTHNKRNHKLQAIWRGPMRLVSSKSNLVFVVEDIIDGQQKTVHAQRMTPYPSSPLGKSASQELKEQATHYDSSYHLVNDIRAVRRSNAGLELLVGWMGFEEGKDETWEPLLRVREDMPGILEDYLHSPGERNLKREILDLYF